MRRLYDGAIFLLTGLLRAAAFFHPKAKKWVAGRRNWRARIASGFVKKGQVLWVHVSSLGEFEQGRPVIEAFRERFPGRQVVLTFFSPSGYEIRKNYPLADLVCYLPADTRRNASDFLDLIQPDVAIFVKYDFWANYLFELKKRGTPTLLVSALFRPGQPFFRWYGGLWRQMLGCFTHIFVQNEPSAALLQGIGFQAITVAGDTRVDRVLALATPPPAPPPEGRGATSRETERFLKTEIQAHRATKPPSPLGEGMGVGLIAGSTWPADEDILLPVLHDPAFGHLRWIIAPHEPSEKHLAQLLPRISRPWVRHSIWDGAPTEVLVIDSIGLLNTLYRYGRVAYIGGGFGKGIHNTLEPAAFGLPVIFGPKYEKFEEARQFVARGGAFPVHDAAELAEVLKKLDDPDFYQKASAAVQGYLKESQGATESVVDFLEQRVLSSQTQN
ncbi:MAG: 3-deoxy-D-manno-octulosonic acid transferase [Saprospiraceae bacterium]|jgi:3-deoxy-D-manno-octulosonic-acid transferase|nr:3-deoxy-D-manno-octulosonic acid transferase [Saprospiraceae bacterium]